jgi:hypothetical protein
VTVTPGRDRLGRDRHGGDDRVAPVSCRPADLQDDIRVEQIPEGTEVMRRERRENLADHGKRLIGLAHGTSPVAAAER